MELLSNKSSPTQEERTEVRGLEELAHSLRALTADTAATSFSKYQRLLAHLRSPDFPWKTNEPQTAWSSSPSALKPCAGCKSSSPPT